MHWLISDESETRSSLRARRQLKPVFVAYLRKPIPSALLIKAVETVIEKDRER